MSDFPIWILIVGAAALYFLWRIIRMKKIAKEAKQWVAEGAHLVDVRSKGEFEGGHLEGAKNIPLSELTARLRELDKRKKVVVYCLSGARSAQAATVLKANGFEAVLNLGPMAAW